MSDGLELLQVIETHRESTATSMESGAFSQELARSPGGQGAGGSDTPAGLRGREVATEPAKRPLERLEGFLGRKDLQLC